MGDCDVESDHLEKCSAERHQLSFAADGYQSYCLGDKCSQALNHDLA